MWTFSITSKNIESGQLKISATFTDGTVTFNRYYFPSSLDELKLAIQSELDKLGKQDILNSAIGLGVISLTITPPTQLAIDTMAFNLKYPDLVKAQQDLDMKLIDQAAFDLVLAEVKVLKAKIP